MRIPSRGKRYRKGILTIRGGLQTYERCDKHGKVWKEGGYNYCKECVENAKA